MASRIGGQAVSDRFPMSFPFDNSPDGSADRDTERDADRGVIEQHRADWAPILIPIAILRAMAATLARCCGDSMCYDRNRR
jgi:hypothetical protein